MKRLHYIIVLFSFLIFNALQAQDFWKNLNVPSQGGLYSVITTPYGNIFYGGEDGVYISEDNGNSWMFSGLPAIGVYALISNLQGDIFAGTDGSNNIYKFIFNEREWISVNKNDNGNVISFAIDDSGNIFASSGEILRSKNDGYNWEKVFDFTGAEQSYDFAIANSDTIYFGTTNYFGGGGVYQSVDSGNTWYNIGMVDHYVSSLALSSRGDLYAGTRGHQYNYTGGVYVLPASENEWKNLLDETLVTSLAITPEDIIYIGCSNLDGHKGGVKVSYDKGQNWEEVNSGLSYKNVQELVLGSDKHLYAIDKNDNDSIFRSVETVTGSINLYSENQHIELFNYPNPFKETTVITYSNSFGNILEIKLLLYTLTGELININTPCFFQGNRKVCFSIDIKEFKGGIYLYKIQDGKSIYTGKMLHIR